MFNNGYGWKYLRPQTYFLDISNHLEKLCLIVRKPSIDNDESQNTARAAWHIGFPEFINADTILEFYGFSGRLRDYDGKDVYSLRGYFKGGNFIYGYFRLTSMREDGDFGTLKCTGFRMHEELRGYHEIKEFRIQALDFLGKGKAKNWHQRKRRNKKLKELISHLDLPSARDGLRALIE